MTKARRRLLLLLPVVLVASCVIWRATRPGYEFPPASKIDRMEAMMRSGQPGNDVFTVPSDEYEEILSALSPSSYDGLGMKWQVLGELTIHTVDGASFQVFLYDSDDRVGAFAAGPTWESRTYYRGGNSAQLRRALDKARAKASTH